VKLKQALESTSEIGSETTATVNNATYRDDLAAVTFHNVNRLPDFATFGYDVLGNDKSFVRSD
jgi:hypothetical protein